MNTKPRAPRKTKTAVQVNMSTELVLDGVATGDDALDSLMAELNGVMVPDDEVILAAEPEVENADLVLESAVAGAELLESYDTEAVDALPADAVAPTEAAPTDEAVKVKPKREKKPKAEKVAGAPRKFYGLDMGSRLADRGVKSVLTVADEALEGADREAKAAEVIALVKGASQKVSKRATYILEFAEGKSANLNNLIRTCVNLVITEGVLTTGKEGNMQKAMAPCFDQGTINSGGMNSVAALRLLQVIIPSADGKGYVANPDSALFPKMQARLTTLAAAAAAETEIAPAVAPEVAELVEAEAAAE